MALTKKPTLLIVDDDPLISDTLSFVLGKDFEITAAESRAQVKSLLMQLDEPPKLALVDLGLPPQPHKPDEGFALIADLLSASPCIKILVLSGQSDEANARHARALGALNNSDFRRAGSQGLATKSIAPSARAWRALASSL